MEYKFKTSFVFKLLYSSLAILLVLFLWMWMYSGNISSLLRDPSPLALLFFGVIVDCLIFINLYRRKVIINDSGIEYVNFWRSRKIGKEFTRGFRFNNIDIRIQSLDKSHSSIRIKDYFSLRDKKKLLELLNERFQNLDNKDFDISKQDILTSWELTPEENERIISQSKKERKNIFFNRTYIVYWYCYLESTKSYFIIHPFIISTGRNHFYDLQQGDYKTIRAEK